MLNKTIRANMENLAEQQNGIFTLSKPSTDALLAVNDVGGMILAKDGETLRAVVADLQAAFPDVDQKTLEKDVLEFVSECQRLGVVELV
jgi:hypothetical protein